MAFADKKGIPMAGGFKLQAEAPLDARFQVDAYTDLAELVTIHAAYEGLTVYVVADKKSYEYHGDDGWVANVTGTAYVHPTTAGNKHIPAGGAANQILLYGGSSGTAQWSTPTKALVGLGNVDNTSDANKPISTATKTALDGKVDKVAGKELSTNDFTDELLEKLEGVEEGANNYTHPANHPATMITEDASHRFMTDAERTKLSGIEAGANKYTHPSTHAASMIVEETNKRFMTDAERTKLSGIEAGANKYTHPANHPATMITDDASHRFVTDAEKADWNAKADVVFDDELPASAPVGAICYSLQAWA